MQRPAPSWLVSSIGRALPRYRRGQGFESLYKSNCKSCFYNYDDLLSCKFFHSYACQSQTGIRDDKLLSDGPICCKHSLLLKRKISKSLEIYYCPYSKKCPAIKAHTRQFSLQNSLYLRSFQNALLNARVSNYLLQNAFYIAGKMFLKE